MFASSCADEAGLDPDNSQMRLVSVKAKTALTKTSISYNEAEKKLAVLWEDADAIAMVFTHPERGSHVGGLTTELEEPNSVARFKGSLDKDVTTDAGYHKNGFVVYPAAAVDDKGSFVFSLPAEQVAGVDGGIAPGLNLSSGNVSLEKIVSKGEAEANFLNACSILRFTLADNVTSMSLEGTANFTGQAPLLLSDDGKLVVDANGTWATGSTKATLVPDAGQECFKGGVVYNLLVWPGAHTALTLSLTYQNIGEFSKTTEKEVTLESSKFYTLNFNPSSEDLLVPLYDMLDTTVGGLTDVEDALDSVEPDVVGLLAQIQSITLMTEYLDNAVYAPYAVFNNGMQKLDISIDYIIKPESAAAALVEAFQADKSIVKGLLGYTKNNQFKLTETELAVNDLVLNENDAIGKFITAYVSAWAISDEFYNRSRDASVALQIQSAKTDMVSEFANLVPKAGSAISGSYLENIKVIPGARVVIPFSFAVSDMAAEYTVTVAGTENVDWATVTYNKDFRTGNLSVQLKESMPVESQKVTLALTVGSGDQAEAVSQEFTFADSGSRIDFVDPGKVDYIGGDVTLEVTTQNVQNYMLSCSGAGVSQSGNVFTFSHNSGAERSVNVECQATIPGVSLNFYKSITLTQKATGTSLSREYYTNGQKVVLNQANASDCSSYLNIVILGDGYQKKDLAVGGKFERSARSAMDSFFSIEPYKSFKDRFNVYMVAYESADEGTDIKSSGVEKNTYFGSYCQGGGNTAAYVADTAPVINAVKAAAGSGDAQYYRSIALLLINTAEQAGSTGYPFRDYKSGFVNGYASFAIAAFAANSTGTNGLVKHEGGGHAFGRLADEYYSNDATASSENKTDLSNWHAKGWYWNVNPNNTSNYYKFTNSAYTADEVGYWEGGWGYQYGMYRPTTGGMMQGSTGVFNAPSRHAIYHRIITETEGADAYSWSKFLEYDQKNR